MQWEYLRYLFLLDDTNQVGRGRKKISAAEYTGINSKGKEEKTCIIRGIRDRTGEALQEGVPGRTYLHCFFFHILKKGQSL